MDKDVELTSVDVKFRLNPVAHAKLTLLAHELEIPKTWVLHLALDRLNERLSWEDKELVSAFVELDRDGFPRGKIWSGVSLRKQAKNMQAQEEK